MLELKLEWVFGYRGHQCRNNLFVNKNGELVYFVAGLGVVLDVEKRAQKTYDGHSDDILCLSVDKSGTLAATGQIGDDPFLCVWDTLCMQTISILKPFKHGIGISIVAFSMNDDHLLVTVGLDDKATVSIWDWKKAKLVAQSAAESTEKVFDARFHHTWPQILVTCGLRHVCIWKLCGNVLSPSRIVLEQTVMCLAFGDDAVTLIGALNGSVYLCHKRECVGEVENAHIGGVFCVCQTKETYITGGRDGSIGIWDSKFKRLSSIDLRHKTGISDLWIRSICVYNDNLFVGSHNSDIIMVSLRDRDNIQILVDGHGQGELWALAVHPKRDVFATGGDDQTVRMWSAGDHTLLHTAKLDQWIRSVVFNHDGSMLVCGLADGSVAVLKSKDLTSILTFKNRKRPIHELQLSSNGEMLAVGCNDGSIDICSVSQRFRVVGTCDGGKDHVTHCDWSADGKLLRANTGAGKQFFFKVPGFKNVSDIDPKTVWATETCVMGANVAGIWPKYSKTEDINAVDVNKGRKLVATGDDFGMVKLFNGFPLTDSPKKVLKYKGHSAHVTNVRWLADGSKLISIGGADHAVFVWRLEENNDNVASEGGLSSGEAEGEVDSDVEREKLPIERRSVTKDKATAMMRQLIRSELKQEGKRRAVPPSSSLKLLHVFGYRGYDCHNNICFTQDGRLIFHVAALGVVQDRDTGVQRFYIGHTDDILSLAIHPQRDVVATGEIGRHPTIHVWDAENPEQQPLSVLKGHHTGGVCALDFSGDDGKKLISVGLDTYHMIIVWDWKRGEKLAEGRGHKDKIFGIRFDPFDSAKAVSVGVKHIKFWATAGGGLTSSRGVFGSVAKMDTMMCVEYGKQKGCCFSGAANGKIYCWLDARLARTVDAHIGPVFAIFALEKGFVTGGKDGKAVLWDETMEKKLKSYSVSDGESSEKTVGNLTAIPNPAVRAVALGHSKIAAGTITGEILEIDKSGSIRVLTKGHCAGEIWGLAAHPKENLCCTGSDDGFVRVWEFGAKFEQRAILNVQKPARSVEFSSDGQYIGVGFSDGSVFILEAASLGKKFEFHHRKEEISDIKFAPEPHKFVAVASHDNFIDVYDYQEGKRIGVCKGHSSYITHIDWDATGALLASNSGDSEMLFFAMPKGEQQLLPANVADETVKWHTRTGVLNPNIFGIWPPSSDVTDINAVDVHPQGQILATADDFGFVKIFQHPCKEKYAKSKRYLGHSAHVASVRWSHDGQYLLSIGGSDTALCVWKLYTNDEKNKQNGNDVPAASPKSSKKIKGTPQFGQSDSSDTDSEEEGGFDSDVEAEKSVDYSSKMYSQPQRDGIILQNRQLLEEDRAKPAVSRRVNEQFNVQRKDPAILKGKKVITNINKLKLEYIFGYRGFDCANNLAYLNEGVEIVFHTAGVGIVLNLSSGQQKFYQKHTDDILCLAVNRNSKFGSLVATGQIDLKSPTIHVWDSNTMKTLSMIKIDHSDGANCIDFSPSGKYLLTVGINAERTVSVFKWQDGSVIAKCSGHSRKIFDAHFRPDNDSSFVTVGVKFVKFWNISGDQLIAKKAVLDNQATFLPTMLSIAFAPNGITYTGCVTGDIFVWNEERLQRIVRNAHNGPIFSMHTSLDDGLITTGAKEKRSENAACVKIWDQELSKHRPYSIQSVTGSEAQVVKSVFRAKGKIVVGTKSCDIVEIQEQNGAAHFILQSHSAGELRGLACHPSKLIAATTSSDQTLRLWDIERREMLLQTRLEEKATCATYSADGSLLAVGMDNGKVAIVNSVDLTPWAKRRDRSARVTQIRFSPDSKYLAVAYQESIVDIHDMSSKPSALQRVSYCKFSSQSVAHMDFSADSKFIKASTGSFDIFIFKVPECVMVTDKNEIKNIIWSTWTDVVGPEVAGIWSEKPSEASIDCATVANFGATLVTGDAQGFVSLFPFPCREPQENNKKFEGHSAHVSNVAFTFDDALIISTGGEDASVFVWRCEE